MAENYVVSYDIQVFDNGTKAISSFIEATKKLQDAQKNFLKLNNQLNSLQQKLQGFNTKKAPNVYINTEPAMRNLDRLLKRMNTFEKMAKRMGVTPGQVIGAGSISSAASTKVAAAGNVSKPARSVRNRVAPRQSMGSLKYHALGQTLMDTGGVGVFDLVKGMGVAYGISGLGSLMGNVIKDSAEYDNIMQSTKNILKSHDSAANFGGRFRDMEGIIRNVGIQTKFTAPQVADASKFLAMAGFDIDAINKAIRPIADIALVGDTDLGQTADVVTNIMTGYGIAPDQVRRAADIMTQTFTMTNTTLMEMAEAYKYAGSLLARNKTPFEEATAAIGILGDAGIKGSQAGTTLRTIAANFAKPTKNQAEAWRRIGVSTTDSNGNVRPMISIFQDLASKNLSLSDYYSIFHKTAASGASALAANVEKWNEVIRQNFLSVGMSKDLAEAKKNTIQGLWAQLTSSFTEAGMRAFASMQAPIKSVMKSVIGWLQSEEGINAIRRITDFVKSLVESLMTLSKWLYRIYKQFEPLAKLWLKFQMFSSVAMIPLRAFYGLKGFMGYLNGVLKTVTGFTRSIAGFNLVLGRTAKTSQYFTGPGFDMKTHSLSDWMDYAGRHNWSTRHALGGYAGQYLLPYTRGVATLGLGGLGAWLGSYIGPSGSGISAVSSILGGLGGSMLGTKIGNSLPGWIVKFAPLLMSPAGWATAAVAALGTAAGAYFIYQNKVEKATNATVEFQNAVSSSMGINWSEQASASDKYLQIVYNRQLDVNQQLIQYLKLRREELGLMDEAQGTPMKDMEKYYDAFEKYGRLKYGQLKELSKDPNSGISILSSIASSSLYDDVGVTTYHDSYSGTYNGIKFSAFDKHTFSSQIQAARLLSALGSDMTSGSENQRLRDDYIYRFLGVSDTQSYNRIRDEWNIAKKNMMASIIPGSQWWSLDTVGNNAEDVNTRGYHYVTSEVEALDRALSEHPALAAYSNILKARETAGAVSDYLLKRFLVSTGASIFDEKQYGKFGSPEFMKIFGYYDDIWHPTSYRGQKLDANGNPLFDRNGNPIYETMDLKTADEARRAFDAFHKQIIEIIKRISPQIQPYFEGILNNPIWNLAGQHKDGDRVDYDGVQWTYRDGKWEAPSPTGRSPMSDDDMQNALKKGNTSFSTPIAASNGGYENYYRPTSAAPKQIILTIGNLMNLEHVDLTNPTNVAVVEDLKEQLAQALVDVVSDFSTDMGNLA